MGNSFFMCIWRYCFGKPWPFTSRTNEVSVKFVSDYSGRFEGFSATYTTSLTKGKRAKKRTEKKQKDNKDCLKRQYRAISSNSYTCKFRTKLKRSGCRHKINQRQIQKLCCTKVRMFMINPRIELDCTGILKSCWQTASQVKTKLSLTLHVEA